jgi:glycosyltransferase involved in cell wall biosynthesis
MSGPLAVSVVLPVLNAAGLIEGAIESVLAQQGVAIELLVVDGGSTDGTLERLRRAHEPPHRVLPGPDCGIYDAMNRGIAAARGDAVYVLGADDRIAHPQALARLAARLGGDPDALVFGDIVVAGPAGGRLRSHRHVTAASLGHESLSHQAVLVARAAFGRIGPFDTRYRLCADLDWFLRAAAAGMRLVHLPGVVCRFGATGASQREAGLQREEVQEILRRHRSAPQRLWQRVGAGLRRRGWGGR